LDKFFEALAVDPDKVCYGKRSVDFAMQNNAIETLLVSDKLFRAKNLSTRKLYVQMVESAERQGITTMIFSSMNPSGERLDNLSGVAALLRYSLPGIDDIEEDDIDIDELVN
jgi:protein pelota